MTRTAPCYVEGEWAYKSIRLRALTADRGVKLMNFKCISLFFSLLPGSDSPETGVEIAGRVIERLHRQRDRLAGTAPHLARGSNAWAQVRVKRVL
jgi:hypothetical protein